ncbi:DEKNAAC103191 [Brettanomyces naardenensis]|uniref:DEKNAAC103191 n=1 Tax=Brettanomyces naardenensis TaxID=13370 RepID=A0A448YMQ4_BRENA|nr:DEKNAAC103191 [Brettanomyces naardenensis]
MITLGLMVYDFLSVLSDVSEAANDSVFWASKRRSLLSFEYEMLIFPIKLSLELSVVSDNVQSSSEALMLHLLGNTLMIAYYGTAALKKGEYGRNLSLYPVPGLYLFIAGIATSNFIVGPRIRDHWGIVAECEIFTARYLLALNREMPFEDFKPSLYLFLRDRTLKVFQTPEAQSLFDEASSLLAGKSYPDNPPDAAAVYWVFSDTRRMTLELYLSN